jgi:hypothetical protein
MHDLMHSLVKVVAVSEASTRGILSRLLHDGGLERLMSVMRCEYQEDLRAMVTTCLNRAHDDMNVQSTAILTAIQPAAAEDKGTQARIMLRPMYSQVSTHTHTPPHTPSSPLPLFPPLFPSSFYPYLFAASMLIVPLVLFLYPSLFPAVSTPHLLLYFRTRVVTCQAK